MKLRTRTNSIRLRLSQGEVAQIANGEAVEDHVAFPTGAELRYVLRSGQSFEANFEQGKIEIKVPGSELLDWAQSQEVGIQQEMRLEASEPLKILIEKDFACLKPRAGEDESDLFPNPDAGSANC